MNKNFGLTQERFDELLEALKNGDDQLFETVFLTHFKSCVQYLVRNYNASQEDAYDVTMDTLLVFHKRMKTGKVVYGNLRFLFTQMAGQHYQRWIKKKTISSELPELKEYASINLNLDKSDLQIFDYAWEELGNNCKTVLKAFYYDHISLNNLAERMGKNPVAIRKQKQRCIEKLRVLFNKIANR